MNIMEPKDFQNKDADSISTSSTYLEDINTLRIEKLSNRVTIISIIIPCLIGAILVFGYLDMKEKVIDVDVDKQNQVERISEQFEGKLNALGVKIAKNTFELDKNMPEVTKKVTTIEGQVAKISSVKIDKKEMDVSLKKLKKQITSNSKQNKITVQNIERVNKKTLSIIEENEQRLNNDLKLLDEDFKSKLSVINNIDSKIALLQKNTSLIDKRQKDLEQSMNKLKEINSRLNLLEKEFNNKLSDLKIIIDGLNKNTNNSAVKPKADKPISNKKATDSIKPKVTIDTPSPGDINEESLSE